MFEWFGGVVLKLKSKRIACYKICVYELTSRWIACYKIQVDELTSKWTVCFKVLVGITNFRVSGIKTLAVKGNFSSFHIPNTLHCISR